MYFQDAASYDNNGNGYVMATIEDYAKHLGRSWIDRFWEGFGNEVIESVRCELLGVNNDEETK